MGEEIDPNKNIGYWLFYAQRCVSYAFAETLRVHCVEQGKPYVITPPQWGILALLYSQDGLTVGSISQQRGVDPPTATGIIKRLEQANLVERRHNREDRRIVKVYLTDEGRNITKSLNPVVSSFNSSMLRDFPQEERDQFLLMMQRIIANLSDEAAGMGDRFKLLPEHIVRQEFVYQDMPKNQEPVQQQHFRG